MTDDSELLRLYAAEGSEDAFRELVNRRIALVYGSALRQLGDPSRARDVVQLVFTDLARKAPSLCRRPVLASWLYTSTHYAVANLRRQERRQRIRDHEAHLMQETNSDGAGDADWERLRPELDRELHALDRRDRDAVLLRFFESKSFADVGQALSMSEEAARKRVERALDRLHGRLARRGITSTAVALSAALVSQAAMAAPSGLAATVTRTAIVHSAVAGATGTGLLNLMTTSKTALAAAALLAAMAVGSAVHENSRERSASAELAALQSESDAASLQLKARESAVSDAEQDVASLEKRARTAKAAKVAAAGKVEGGPSQAARLRGDAFMERHPEVRTALVALSDANTHAKYSALYASLGLTSDQIRRMEELLRSSFGFGRSGQGGVVSLVPPGDLSYSDQQSQLKELLGDAGYDQYVAYSATVPARGVASDLAGLLMAGDSLLTSGQAQQMVGILAASADAKDRHQFDWPSVYANAQGILSPSQLQMLQAIGTQAQGWQQVQAAVH
jgi:RNA polymerase sigma factor (sigma-70 family)